jgi:dihydrofolate reductase
VRVIYSMSVSLDGLIAGPAGEIDWAAPDDELMAFHIEQTRALDGHLCGRGLYEDMLPWETREGDFAEIWKAIPKIVFSTTLASVEGNARLATASVSEELSRLAETRVDDVSVGGAGLAATLVEHDLIDEYRPFVNPVVLGGGTPFFPERRERLELELVETRKFGSRVYLRYRRPPRSSDG